MHKIIALKLTACTDCTQKYRYTYAGYAYIYTTYKSLNFVHNGFPYICSYRFVNDNGNTYVQSS